MKRRKQKKKLQSILISVKNSKSFLMSKIWSQKVNIGDDIQIKEGPNQQKK